MKKNSIRKECEKKKKEFFPNDDKRFMFLPVDWRSSLILDDGIVESITIKTIAFIRDRLNSSVSYYLLLIKQFAFLIINYLQGFRYYVLH